jgi:diacylglycerol O-acyltransferase
VGYWHYDRLSALDASFLELEDDSVHMHVGAVAILEAAPLTTAEGLLDFDRLRGSVESSLALTPRFRQKLAMVPWFEQPVWIDDPYFNLNYHLRHTALPRPGSARLLKRLAARILSQKLDRGKPLWEMWIVEGVEEECFAVIVKAHHCMVDGISGLELLARMMRLDPDPTVEPVASWIPRPGPSGLRLLTDELWRRASLPFSLARLGQRVWTRPAEAIGDLQEALLGFGEVMSAGLRPTLSTPLNPEIGPYRRFDWTRMELAAVKEVRSRLGGTLNDVVLATAAGAIGRFLRQRGVVPDGGVFRAQVPVSIRSQAERGAAGNRVAMLLADLPIAERDPRRRLRRVIETTQRLKRSRQRAGVEFLEELADRSFSAIFNFFARLAVRQRSFNVVITNVPGPPREVYLLGARMRAIHPLVPLADNHALGIALFSYAGTLFWGFHADWDALPDLHDLVGFVDEEFEALRKADEEPPRT